MWERCALELSDDGFNSCVENSVQALEVRMVLQVTYTSDKRLLLRTKSMAGSSSVRKW